MRKLIFAGVTAVLFLLSEGESIRKCYQCLERIDVSSGVRTYTSLDADMTPLAQCGEVRCYGYDQRCVTLDSGGDGERDVYIYRNCADENMTKRDMCDVIDRASGRTAADCVELWQESKCGGSDLCNVDRVDMFTKPILVFATWHLVKLCTAIHFLVT